jgi:4-hydroxythreonine-4-phosphate dehydrogenase
LLDVAVIADDLTGAADCGIAFTTAGLATFVAFGDAPAPAGVQVLAVDTDSRRLGQEEAVRRAEEAARRALAAEAGAIYRKIDSTLRGHVGPELAATLRALSAVRGRPALAILAPAFPGTGRTTRGGEVLVKGVPLEETEVWRDARMTVPSRPAALLRAAGLRAEEVGLAHVQAGAGALARELERLAAGGTEALVPDAVTEEDLASIAGAGARLERPVLWSGSAGLARHLPRALALTGDPSHATSPRPRAEGAVLVLVGSRSSVAREQARVLAAEPGVRPVALDPHALLSGPGGERGAAEELARALGAGEDVVATFGEASVGVERGPTLAAAAARLAAPHARRLRGLVATGGDVARALLAALGATGLHLVGEVEPGVPIGVSDSEPPLAIVTKAGAFGDPQTLSRSRAALRAVATASAGAGG